MTAYWIYSWDGEQGTFINKDRKAILNDFRSTGRFVDLTGDGILEIVGWREVREELVFENGEAVGKESIMERIAYSWNGQEYGQWPSTPDPPEDDGEFAGSIPRDQMTIRVKASAQRINADTFQYQYEVTNAESSRQSLHDIFAAPDTAAGLQHPTGWNGVDFVFFRLKRWIQKSKSSQNIHPGEQGNFSYTSPSLPDIGTMYFRGHTSVPFLPSGKSLWREQVYDNSVPVKTIEARYPPDSTEYQGYLDTLRTYPERARQQGWITTDAAASRYEETLNAAYDHLAAADSVLAQQALSEVATQAEADSGDVLTSEGYALLYYNADYLAQRLPANSPLP